MSDVHCLLCGEPWDTFYLTHDVWGELSSVGWTPSRIEAARAARSLTPEVRKAFEDLGWKFGSDILIVRQCDCCPDELIELAEERLDKFGLAKAEGLYSSLRGDPDGFATELSELGG